MNEIQLWIVSLKHLAPVVRRVDNAFHHLNNQGPDAPPPQILKVIKNAIRSGLQVTVTKTPQGDSYQLFSFALQYYLLHLEGSHTCD